MKLQNVFWNLDEVPVVMDPTGEAQTLDGSATPVDALNRFGVPLTEAVFASLVRRGVSAAARPLPQAFPAGSSFWPPMRKNEKHAQVARGRLKHSDPTGRGVTIRTAL